MQKASTDYDWDQALGESPPDQQIDHYDNTIINIAKNFIPNEFKKFNAKEPPGSRKAVQIFIQSTKKNTRFLQNTTIPLRKKTKLMNLKKNIQIWLKKKKTNI